MSKKRILIPCIIGLLLLIILIGLVYYIVLTFLPKIRRDLSDWEKGKYLERDYCGPMASYIIPSYDACSGYENAEFYWLYRNYYPITNFFGGNDSEYAVCLELSYNSDSYLSEKEKVFLSYEFLAAPIPDGEYFYMPVSETQIGSYSVYILDDRIDTTTCGPVIAGGIRNGNYTWYPSSFGFVAFDDAARKIRFCFIYDHELDYMEDPNYFIKYVQSNFKVEWD